MNRAVAVVAVAVSERGGCGGIVGKCDRLHSLAVAVTVGVAVWLWRCGCDCGGAGAIDCTDTATVAPAPRHITALTPLPSI